MLLLKVKPNESVTVRTPEGRVMRVTVIERLGTHAGLRLGFTGERCIEVVRDDAKVKTPPERLGGQASPEQGREGEHQA